MTSVSQHGRGQAQGSSTQYRVARIMQDGSTDLVFDLTAGAFDVGHVRAIHFHIGDDEDK